MAQPQRGAGLLSGQGERQSNGGEKRSLYLPQLLTNLQLPYRSTSTRQLFTAQQVPPSSSAPVVESWHGRHPPRDCHAQPYDTFFLWHNMGNQGTHLPHLNTNQMNLYVGKLCVLNGNHSPRFMDCSVRRSATPLFPHSSLRELQNQAVNHVGKKWVCLTQFPPVKTIWKAQRKGKV